MMSTEQRVSDYYARSDLVSRIEGALSDAGLTLQSATLDDLAQADEFHIGGRPATVELCRQLELHSASRVLDIGSGIGGTARFVAESFGSSVTGLDLTPAYVEAARSLSAAVAADLDLRYEVGSALDMPFADGHFDRAVQLHVGMNIEDKPALFAEVHRVLEPGSRFGIYDIMRLSDAPISFPVPWSSEAATSFVDRPGTYRAALVAAGFEVVAERSRQQFAADFFAAARAKAGEQSPVGLHLVMGEDSPTKLSNMIAAVAAGSVAPYEIIAVRR